MSKPHQAKSAAVGDKGKGKAVAVDRDVVETFMERDAEESDEEIAFGFGAGGPDDKDDEEDENGEEAGEDGHVEGLVDDQEMDDETLAKQKILEKVA